MVNVYEAHPVNLLRVHIMEKVEFIRNILGIVRSRKMTSKIIIQDCLLFKIFSWSSGRLYFAVTSHIKCEIS